ncbi:MAG: hypothetical protein EHM41_03480 [Chloroflexi bacterium]|nr:MAG: hypothetical protein EHM41_03480 [Chloroflexota bacterium]
MARIEDAVFCDGCGVEITWSPVIVSGKDYCCADCRDGLVCYCGDRMEMEDERRTGSDVMDTYR